MGKWRFLLYAVLLLFPIASQILYPKESIWEPIWWTVGVGAIIFAIEKWGKP